MKRNFIILLAAMFLIAPSMVNADLKIDAKPNDKSCVTDNGMCESTVDLVISSDENFEFTKETVIDGSFMAKEGVVYKGSKGSDLFDIVVEGTNIKLTLKDDSLDMKAGEKFTMATITYEFKSDIEDCSVAFKFKQGEVEIPTVTPEETPDPENPETGNFFPLIQLGIASIIGAGTFLVISKKSSLFRV